MRQRLRIEQGQTMAEYGVILSMMTATIIAALLFFSDEIRNGIMRAVALMRANMQNLRGKNFLPELEHPSLKLKRIHRGGSSSGIPVARSRR